MNQGTLPGTKKQMLEGREHEQVVFIVLISHKSHTKKVDTVPICSTIYP